MSPEVHQAMLRQRERFIDKFGREPGPGDPVFFDPDADKPAPLREEKIDQALSEAVKLAGTPPELAYAFAKTGLLVTEKNIGLLSEEDLKEWQEAVKEYRRRKRH